jgi:predicted nucleotidyltransferase
MSDTSSLTYRDLAIDYFLEVFQLVDEVMKDSNAPYYLIGVNATDIQLLKEKIKPSRGTKDIDFAVMVPSFFIYDSIKEKLVNKGFNQAKEIYTLYHPAYNVAIDLLPFGQIEENDTINFTDRSVDLIVLGFKEILGETKTISIDENLFVQVPPLHGMIILKLIAWSDRPEHRTTDLEDIYRIVKHYYDVETNSVFDEHFDLLETSPVDKKMIAARIMGRMIASILAKSIILKNRVEKVLEENTSDPVKSAIGRHWASKYDIELDYAINLLKAIKIGIIERE